MFLGTYKIKNEWFKYSQQLLERLEETIKTYNPIKEHTYWIDNHQVTKEEFDSINTTGTKFTDLTLNVQNILKGSLNENNN